MIHKSIENELEEKKANEYDEGAPKIENINPLLNSVNAGRAGKTSGSLILDPKLHGNDVRSSRISDRK